MAKIDENPIIKAILAEKYIELISEALSGECQPPCGVIKSCTTNVNISKKRNGRSNLMSLFGCISAADEHIMSINAAAKSTRGFFAIPTAITKQMVNKSFVNGCNRYMELSESL